MTKQQLQTILSSPYDQAIWKQVLIEIFGVKRILQTPQPIYFANTQKASEAYELGSFSTKDDRIIGIYQVNVNPEVWLERNKVGLRTLLRDVYKYDVDGALIVFVQENKWRLSFVSEIKTLNEKGEIQTQATEPRRYTYLLGEGEKVLTPAQNLAKIAGKPLTLEDIRNAFSVEALNEEFYKIIAQQFYELVGATAGKGKNSRTYERKLQLPSTSDAKTYQEFAVRLIGRTIFCWFLKVKKSNDGLSLLPEHLLGRIAVIQTSNYYHTVLERLFFQTLNTPMEKRPSDLPDGANQIPFLNGGLFDYQEDDFYIPNKITGLSENINTLIIPDQWFLNFFQELEKYNFTIDENSTVDIEVSVDPEMLGRIFENLLAEIDPDSGETARKATGSFYTPREIVDYMATESLVHYLHNKTAIEKESLSILFKIDSQIPDNSVLITQKVAILEALDALKILDPACGSGAFPMGVLQKIVMALQKVDPNSVWWKNKQIEKNDNPVVKNAVREKLNAASVEYARKIGIIQNSLYGVDIQPIAAEISKLRCFLTLIVDENIDENKPNRGVEPLPNLEFKFVTADSLRKLPLETNYGGLFNANDDLEQLKRIRQDYLQSFGEDKAILRADFKKVQDRVAKQQSSLGKNIDTNSRAYLIGTWKPFSHEKVDWFDPEWMFGFKEFDIVIGNPPYGTSIKGEYRNQVEKSWGKVPDYEIYYFFIERAYFSLSLNGVLSYIIPNTYLFNTYASTYRKGILDKWKISEILDCTNFPIFKSAVVRNTINIWEKALADIVIYRNTQGVNTFQDLIKKPKLAISMIQLNNFSQNWGLAFSLSKEITKIINKITSETKPLSSLFPEVSQGLIAYDKYQGQSEDIIKSRAYHYSSLDKDNLKKWLWGSDINRYKVTWNEKEYIDYCDGIANPRQPKFFHGSRILIREITNPSIFAAYTEEELYNDPSILIILNSHKFSIKVLLAILNSKLATFYHFNSSPKATKGAFPKVLIQDINDFPLPEVSYTQTKVLEVIVNYILYIKSIPKENPINEYVPNSHIVDVFEEVIDGMVYELYFKKDFEAVNIEFIKYAERDFRSIESIDDESEKIKIIHEAYQKLREKDNEIKNNLKLIDTRLVHLISPIKNSK